MKHLSKDEVAEIATLIDAWPMPTIHWEVVCREVELRLGRRYTRRTLGEKPEIREAYHRAKGIRTNPNFTRPRPKTDDRVQQLEAEIQSLKRILAEYDLRFLRHLNALSGFQHAASGAPVLPKDLEFPLHQEIPLLSSRKKP